MENTFLSMTEIIDRLKEWKENTDIDISSDWIEDKERQDYTRQSTQLATAIGLLSTLGKNGNIKYTNDRFTANETELAGL